MFKIWVVLIFILGVNCQLCDEKVCACTNNTCLACTAAFLYRTNITCSPCPFMCKTCSSALSCSGCISNFYLVSGSCLLCPQHCMTCTPVCAKCMNGYYLLNGNCIVCSSANALTCDNSDMVMSCSSGYWQNGNSCSPCRQFCLICSSPSNCLQCQQGYMVAISFGSYCSKCSTGCKTCSTAGCSACFYNYQLDGGTCLDVSGNCSSISQCQSCAVVSGHIVCHSCYFPYYISNGICIKGASLLCQGGASGPMFYQCLDSCTPFGYFSQAMGTSMVCLPLQWLSTARQIYLNPYDSSFSSQLYSTSMEQIYFDQSGNSISSSSSSIFIHLTLEPYYKLMLNFKLLAEMALGTNLSITFTLSDNSSNSEQYASSVLIDTNPQAIYKSLTTKSIKDQAVVIKIESTKVNQSGVPITGLSECLIQVFPCPSNCRLCYNAELCIECEVGYFNTPDYLCVSDCSGYLQLYLPTGDPSNYIYKQCVLSCPDSFYALQLTSVYRCQKCSGLCLTCLSETQCLSCSVSYLYYQIDFSCVLSCPLTHYNLSNVCTLCGAPCSTCSDAVTCLTCSIGYYYNGSCIGSCPEGTFENVTANVCDQCDFKCLSCQGSATFCLACRSQYLLFQSSCATNCLTGLYYESEGKCQACLSPCLTCLNATSCLSCQVGYLMGTSCVTSCPSGCYADGLTSSCKSCQNGCQTCQSQTICLTCPNTSNLYNYQCLAECPSGTYSSSNICLNCLEPCSNCLNQTYCLACSIGYLSQLSLGSCLSACEDGFYSYSQNLSCIACSSTCLTCASGPAICASCSPGYFLEGSACVSVCSLGFYNYSSSGVCVACSYPCLSCVASDYSCTSCQAGYILVNSNCLTECPEYTYLDGSECKNCVGPCQTCVSLTGCSSCLADISNQTYLHERQCLVRCPAGYYEDSVSLSCSSCNYPCATCSSSSLCLSCLSGYLNVISQSCQYCSGIWFGNETSNRCQLCSSSVADCSECFSATECSLCLDGSFLFNGTCISRVQCLGMLHYYVDENLRQCLGCVNPCETCLNASYCSSCKSGVLYEGNCISVCGSGWFQSNGVCLVCNASCLTCSEASVCLTCNASGLFPVFYEEKQQCIAASDCGSGYYIDSSYGWLICSKCSSPCLTCLNSSFCLTCLTGFSYFGSCKSICPSGYYADSGNASNAQCLPCGSSCFKCMMISTNCTACSSSLYLKNGSCVSNCGEGYYLDSYIYECFACVKPCLNCSTASSCLSCLNSSYILYQSQCILSCPSGTYQLGQNCLACPSSCLTCSQNSSSSQILCIQCVSGMYMSMVTAGLCTSSCRTNEYGDNVTHSCYSCIAPCLGCKNAIDCLGCQEGYLLVGLQCLAIDRCPAGRYLLGKECVLSCGALWAGEQAATCQAGCSAPALKIEQAQKLCVIACPSNYKVDLNYTCTKCINSGCDDLLLIELQIKSIFNVLYLKISFSSAVQLSNLPSSALTVAVSPVSGRLLASTVLNYSIKVINLNALWLQLQTPSSIENSMIAITFSDYYLFSTPLQKLSYTSELVYFDLYTADELQSSKKFQSYSLTMSIIMMILFLLDILLNSGYLSYLIIDCYQLLFMMLFLSIDYPPPLNRFLYGFRYSHYLFLPQLFRGDPKQQYSSETPDKFGVVVPDVYFLNNTGPTFIIIAFALGTLILSKLLQMSLKKIEAFRSNKVGDESSPVQAEGSAESEGRCSRLLQAITSRFKWNYFNDVIYIIYFSVMLFAFSQLYDLTWRSGTAVDLLSIVLAFGFIVIGIAFPLGLAYFLHSGKDSLIEGSLQKEKNQMKQKEKEKKEREAISNEGEIISSGADKSKKEQQSEKNGSQKTNEDKEKVAVYEILTDFKCFVAGVKLRVRLGFYHIPLKYLKKLIMACLLVYCSQFPSFVLGIAMMFCLINILIVLFLKPYRLTFQQILFPIFDSIYLLVFFTICIMQLPLLDLTQTQKLNASYLAIALCILLSLLLAIHNIVMNICEGIKFFWGVDYLSKYYQTEYVETTEQQVESEQITEIPLKKQVQKQKQSQSMLSGLDIYLRKDSTAPQFLIKCLKPDQEGVQQQALNVGDIKLDEFQLSESEREHQSASEKGSASVSGAEAKNIFLNMNLVQIEGEDQD